MLRIGFICLGLLLAGALVISYRIRFRSYAEYVTDLRTLDASDLTREYNHQAYENDYHRCGLIIREMERRGI